jgi:vacuolar protein 8
VSQGCVTPPFVVTFHNSAHRTAHPRAMEEVDDIGTLIVADLRARCRDAGLRVSGRKAELVRRLRDAPVVLMPANLDAGSRPPATSHAHCNSNIAWALAACALAVWWSTPVAIPPLVALVRDGTDAQKEHAVWALGWLAFNADNQIAIAKAGGIPPLVALIRDGTDAQKAHAVWALGWANALRSLPFNADNQIAIAKAGGIPPLVALVRDGTDEQKYYAAGALMNLAANADNREAIIPPLVALIRDGTDAQKAHAVWALGWLAVNDDNREAIIPPLVALIRDGNDAQKASAAGALWLVAFNADNQIAIAKAGGIPPLVALVRDGTDHHKSSAAIALGSLAICADNKIAIAKAGGIPPLVALIRDGNAAQKAEAAGALWGLAVNADNKIAIAKAIREAGLDNLYKKEVENLYGRGFGAGPIDAFKGAVAPTWNWLYTILTGNPEESIDPSPPTFVRGLPREGHRPPAERGHAQEAARRQDRRSSGSEEA